jgi:hypothetical protein
LVAAVLASGCTQTTPSAPSGNEPTAPSGNEPAAPSSGEASGDPDAAYDQLEQELDQAVEDIDLGDLENEISS